MDWVKVIGEMLPVLGPDAAIGGIVLCGVIVALVQACKVWFKMPTKYAPYVAFVFTILGYGLVKLVAADVLAVKVVGDGLGILVLFLTVTGFYKKGDAAISLVKSKI